LINDYFRYNYFTDFRKRQSQEAYV
jgi:hypothetical protein